MKDSTPTPDEADVDFDALAIEQTKKHEPDQLDGPAWNLDRRLDDEDPQDGT